MTSPAAEVVLLHGFACLPRMWRPVIAQLGQRACNAPLLAGHGPAPSLPPDADFMQLARWHGQSLPARYRLVGYSLGGRLALALALAQPERCLGLVLIGAGLGLGDAQQRAARQRWDAEQADRLERLGVARFMDQWEQLPLFRSQARLPLALRQEVRAQRLSHRAEGLAWVMRRLGLGNMPHLAPRLSELAMPLTMITGAEDERYTALAGQACAQLDGARQLVIAGAGHNVVLEQPAQLAEQLRAALAVTAVEA